MDALNTFRTETETNISKQTFYQQVLYWSLEDWSGKVRNIWFQNIGRMKTPKECMIRAHYLLKDDWDFESRLFMVESTLGNSWTEICLLFQDKSDTACKNRFYSAQRRLMRHLGKKCGPEEANTLLVQFSRLVMTSDDWEFVTKAPRKKECSGLVPKETIIAIRSSTRDLISRSIADGAYKEWFEYMKHGPEGVSSFKLFSMAFDFSLLYVGKGRAPRGSIVSAQFENIIIGFFEKYPKGNIPGCKNLFQVVPQQTPLNQHNEQFSSLDQSGEMNWNPDFEINGGRQRITRSAMKKRIPAPIEDNHEETASKRRCERSLETLNERTRESIGIITPAETSPPQLLSNFSPDQRYKFMKQLAAMHGARSIELSSISPLSLVIGSNEKQYHHSRVTSFFTPLSMIAATMEMVETEAHPFSPIPTSSYENVIPIDEESGDLVMSARTSMSTMSI
jgi:hypothetical protein